MADQHDNKDTKHTASWSNVGSYLEDFEFGSAKHTPLDPNTPPPEQNRQKTIETFGRTKYSSDNMLDPNIQPPPPQSEKQPLEKFGRDHKSRFQALKNAKKAVRRNHDKITDLGASGLELVDRKVDPIANFIIRLSTKIFGARLYAKLFGEDKPIPAEVMEAYEFLNKKMHINPDLAPLQYVGNIYNVSHHDMEALHNHIKGQIENRTKANHFYDVSQRGKLDQAALCCIENVAGYGYAEAKRKEVQQEKSEKKWNTIRFWSKAAVTATAIGAAYWTFVVPHGDKPPSPWGTSTLTGKPLTKPVALLPANTTLSFKEATEIANKSAEELRKSLTPDRVRACSKKWQESPYQNITQSTLWNLKHDEASEPFCQRSDPNTLPWITSTVAKVTRNAVSKEQFGKDGEYYQLSTTVSAPFDKSRLDGEQIPTTPGSTTDFSTASRLGNQFSRVHTVTYLKVYKVEDDKNPGKLKEIIDPLDRDGKPIVPRPMNNTSATAPKP